VKNGTLISHFASDRPQAPTGALSMDPHRGTSVLCTGSGTVLID